MQFKMEDKVHHDGDMFKFTANNYSYWKPMMEDHLYCKDLHEPIIYKDKVQGKSDTQWELLNRKVVAMISLLLFSSLPESWDTLVVTLSNSAPEGKLTMNTVSDSLLDDEIRRMKRGNILNVAYDDSSWIVDSDASFHVTPHGNFFSSYQSGDFGMVQMGNQDRSKIVRIGDIILMTGTGCKLILKDVRHVPTMRLNLISTGKLDDVGLINYFGQGKWKLTKGSLRMSRGKKE
ncbi:hypothetical protein F3Y22_tig00111837pilonHSYRG00278 [Hibiscus syriacus]|uniref:Retrovirus-related Pol polyprotein from transposon TNT 1-94-like beta-barrel domain-containing protein n=1 Tax=Hibiscus syriacus TaxID=106335 RepID=A0A6A2YED2_HIBSY|nr:hypothetical protein F3Y22_tig00111837pilonHSYRG00278 [Hibiscus syriacus]